MRRLIGMMALWLTMACAAWAQNGLNVAPLFDGKIIPQERLVETRVKGRMLSRYQLSLFRSVRFTATADEQRQVLRLMKLDEQQNEASQATERRTGTTLMIQLPAQGRLNRYLCYKSKGREVTVVYMEGTIGSLDSLAQILK